MGQGKQRQDKDKYQEHCAKQNAYQTEIVKETVLTGNVVTDGEATKGSPGKEEETVFLTPFTTEGG